MGNNSALLIIGNGFDLSCGLKTSYRYVYKDYISTDSDSELISNFKKDISDQYDSWADFEMGMAQYAKRLKSGDELIECINDFNQFMHRYLINVQHSFRQTNNQLMTNRSIIEEIQKSIGELGKGSSHIIDDIVVQRRANSIDNIAIITFNYTDTLEYLLSKAYQDGVYYKSIHIHGTLSDDVILGVDNEAQIQVDYPITVKVRRCFIKPYFNSVFDQRRIDEAKDAIASSDTIFVFGASLGDSDITWRNEIIDWLKSNEKHHLFLYIHSCTLKHCKTVSDRMNQEDDAKNELLRNWNIDGSEIIDRVHIPFNIKLFDIEKAIQKDQKITETVNKAKPRIIAN